MSLAPSTTSYAPFNPKASAFFKEVQNSNYLNVAFLMLLLYDHAITLDKEVAWIWTLRWRLPKVIFLINRYVITWLILLQRIPSFIFPLSIPFCHFYHHFLSGIPLFNLVSAELIIMVRVAALYGHNKPVIGFLSGLLVLAVTVSIYFQVIWVRTTHITLFYKYLPGCWQTMVPENINTQWRVLSPFVVVDGVLVLLVAYKLILYRKEMNRTFAVLARDSIFYFIIVFAFLALVLANDAGAYLPVNFLPPSQCISSIVAGRMMMNIRGLILDDPGNTIHLKSLHFAEGTYSDSETGVASSFALQTYAIA